MKRLNYIFALCALLFAYGCENNLGLPEEEDNHVIIPGGEYIYLDAGVSTRGSLVEGTSLNAGFGAYGFTYNFNNRWTTFRVTGKPNVFGSVPQEVTYNDGFYSYTPMKQWEGGKYTFFAYYPYGNDNVVPSGDEENTPYVTYSPSLSSTSNHADIMTAIFEDTSLSSSPYAYFDFHHRLAAVDVAALNFYEYSHNEDGSVHTDKVTIEITDLSLAFKNLSYKSAQIYLDRRVSSVRTENDAENDAASFTVVSGGNVEITPSTTSDFQLITNAASKQTMLLIPQENENLEVTTTITFKKRLPNGTYLTDDGGGDTFTDTKLTSFGQALKEGSRYYIQITFTSSAVSINIITSAEWDEINNIDHEFE